MEYFACKDIVMLVRTAQDIVDWDFLSAKLEWSDAVIISEFRHKINWKVFSRKLGTQYGSEKKHMFRDFGSCIDWNAYDAGARCKN